MRRSFLLILPFLLVACNAAAGAAPMIVPPTLTPPPTFTLLSISPTSTPTPFPADTATPTETSSSTPTEAPTCTPTEKSMEMTTETPVSFSFVYVFPVQPAKLAGFTEGGHSYPATDIFAPAGLDFVAVTNGVVDNVSCEDRWDPVTNDPSLSGGLWVSILGDDGVRYYGAHLLAIANGIRRGVRVKAGDLLGLVGNTGDARTTLPHVHFEISRPTSPYDWMSRDGLIDPFPFLQAWRDGHNITPPLITP